MSNKENFRFFVPFEISKAKDKEGKEVMKIAGIASTSDRDSDGEVLDTSGFDLSYFMSNGFINWHHQSKGSPEAIIGEPTKAEIRKEGLYVEGLLYPESKLAKQVYELATGLEKSSSTRRLGFSIEGKVLERDLLDERFVKRAKITGLAVTPAPKNASTLVDIMKGNFTDFEYDIAELEPTLDANGGKTLIIDITRPNGDRITVDTNYNIKVLSKATDIANAGVLSPADVEGKIKNLQSNEKIPEKNNKEKENLHKFANLNKSILFDEILKATDDFETTTKLINSINFKNMKTKNVKLDDLVKALTDIGVEVDPEILKAKDTDADDTAKEEKDADGNIIEKSKDNDADDAAKKEAEEKEKEEIEKAITDKEKELELLKAKRSTCITKAEGEKADDKKNDAEPDADADDEKVENIVKKKMGDMEKGIKDELGAQTESFSKGINDLTSLFTSFTKSINERIEEIEKTPLGRKSMGTSKVIEKAFGGADEKHNEGKMKLSVSKNRQQISNVLLTKSGIEKGEFNEFYGNAMTQFEASGQLSKAIVTDLYTNANILITE